MSRNPGCTFWLIHLMRQKTDTCWPLTPAHRASDTERSKGLQNNPASLTANFLFSCHSQLELQTQNKVIPAWGRESKAMKDHSSHGCPCGRAGTWWEARRWSPLLAAGCVCPAVQRLPCKNPGEGRTHRDCAVRTPSCPVPAQIRSGLDSSSKAAEQNICFFHANC